MDEFYVGVHDATVGVEFIDGDVSTPLGTGTHVQFKRREVTDLERRIVELAAVVRTAGETEGDRTGTSGLEEPTTTDRPTSGAPNIA
ncbi:hypothetical protein [Natronomonas pharaonis]|uniref:hypothetical protein n=1 Tax=Natronomonas pharaonis TaxID=2257 RepID=UPI001E3A1B52|nr:hypothetical protein [Natronomonas pharaonis]